MARTRRTKALLAFALAAASIPGAARAREPHNRTLYSWNQPVVERADYVLDVAAPSGNVSSIERARLRAWFTSLDLGYGDRVFVEEPYGPAGATADVARVAAEFGLLLSPGAPLTEGRAANGSVRVIVRRSTASVPGCPNWNASDSVNSTSSNFGCATNSNLAAMIADPSDLVLGQTRSGTADPTQTNKAIKIYRETPPTGVGGLKSESSKGN